MIEPFASIYSASNGFLVESKDNDESCVLRCVSVEDEVEALYYLASLLGFSIGKHSKERIQIDIVSQ